MLRANVVLGVGCATAMITALVRRWYRQRTEAQLRANFERDGYVIIKGLLTAAEAIIVTF